MDLKSEKVVMRDPSKMPPLLLRLSERPPKEQIQWLGVSFGLTGQLHKFWKRSGYVSVYVRQTSNELTGEHTCIMLKDINTDSESISCKNWLKAFSGDFKKRFLQLLAYQFRAFAPSMVLGMLTSSQTLDNEYPLINSNEISRHFTPFDLKRLESYAKNLLDYHVILDLVPEISKLYFLNMLPNVELGAIQSAILVGLGLQKKVVEDLEKDLKIQVSQILALFAKGIRKLSNSLREILEKDIKEEISKAEESANPKLKVKDIDDIKQWEKLDKTLDEDLEDAGNEAVNALKQKQRELIDGLSLGQ
jgi:N-acetyltransferase 10